MADREEDECDSDPLQDYLLGDIVVSGRELGLGSYSSVLEMRYKGMRCAGKKLHRTLYEQGVSEGPEILERFGTECELLSQLRHPHIVQFLGLYLEDGSDVPVLVLEYMPIALTDCIERYGILADEISYSILHDVALGLHYLHSHTPAIIHRDLTANNILLTSNMTAKISDLGMAKILNLAPALMAQRMTVCPGTISYMPPEALTPNPRYDTKLDCFSFGILMIHIFCGEWPIALEYLQVDPNKPGHFYPLTEIERREKYLRRIGAKHPLIGLIKKCIGNIASERPETSDILTELRQVVSLFPPSFENRIEMLNRIKADSEKMEQLRAEVGQLRTTHHEKEHAFESLSFRYNTEVEHLKEQITRLEQSCAIQEVQLTELHSENNRLHFALRQKEEEVQLLKRKVDHLDQELQTAHVSIQEWAWESAQRLKQLQSNVEARSHEREAALESISRGQLDTALKHTLRSKSSDELSHDFEEFFLNSADDIADLLKQAPNVTSFQAHQLVCEMVQQSYAHCKAQVLHKLRELVDLLFTVDHTGGNGGKSTLADARTSYGLLLRATKLQSSLHYKAIAEQILRSFLGRECFKHASQQAISSMKQHIQNACKLTWGLATAWPPLIVAQPGEFREELHDREFQYWDRSNQSLKLYYTRPVLFHSYRLESPLIATLRSENLTNVSTECFSLQGKSEE